MPSSLDVSIIIATHNRSQPLRATLESMRHQLLRQLNYEVIVVANACSDDTEEALAHFASTMVVVPLYLDRAGKSAALNQGMDVARGDLIVFTDDDVVLSENWIPDLSQAST